MAKLWLKFESQKSEPEALYDYIHLLMIGFAGSKPMITCSCMAMSALATEFKGMFVFIAFFALLTSTYSQNTLPAI